MTQFTPRPATPHPETAMPPETVLQFGSGRFLRAFADLFIHHANVAGQAAGRVVVVQSTGSGRAGGFNAQAGRYHVGVRGYQDGETVDRVEVCESVARAISAADDWPAVLAVATSPDLKTVLSNTTEAGYALDPADVAPTPDGPVPTSFPAKLLAVLAARHRAGLPGVTVIPCELLEGNAKLLRETVLTLAGKWGLSPALIDYITDECVWLHTLVDRIVTGAPEGHPILGADPLACVAEPFAFWALEDHPRSQFTVTHPAITRAADVSPYFSRKVRILNAAHTALLIKAVPRGFQLVREAVADPELLAFLRGLLFDEIVPTLEGRVDSGARFAEQTLDRFRNPFLDHKFADIALHHASKVEVRLRPTAAEFRQKFGREPRLLMEVLGESKKG